MVILEGSPNGTLCLDMMRGERGGGSGEGEERLAHDTGSVYGLQCSNAVPLAAVPTISSVTILTPSPNAHATE